MKNSAHLLSTIVLLFVINTNALSQSVFDKSTVTLNSSVGRNYLVGNAGNNPGMLWTFGAGLKFADKFTLSSSYSAGSVSGEFIDGSYRTSFRINDADLGYNKAFVNAKSKFINNSSVFISGGVALINGNINSSSFNRGAQKIDMAFFAYKLVGGYSYKLNDVVSANANINYYFLQTGILDAVKAENNDGLFIISLGIGVKVFDGKADSFKDELTKTIQKNGDLNSKLLTALSDIDNKNQLLINRIDSQNTLLNNKLDFIAKNKTGSNASDTSTKRLSYTLESAPDKINDSVNYTIKYPRHKYNVVFGGFFSLKNALSEVAKLKKSGINAEPYWKGDKSKLVFLVVFSSNDYQEAQEKIKYFRKKGRTDAWLYTANTIKK